MTAHQAATAAIDRATTPRVQQAENITDFKRLTPKEFSSNEKPLAAEQWLLDTSNLLQGANIPEAEQVKIVKVQLVDIAHTWWAVEETKLIEPASWKQFTDSFYERFFPVCAKKEMEDQFMKLQQWNKTVDEYATEFLRLSRFAPKLVAEEADRAERFQQGLRVDLQV